MTRERKPYTFRSRGFTIPELLVTVVIGMALMAGVAVMFGKISEGLIFSRGLHTELQASESFRETYSRFSETYPLLIAQSGGVFSVSEFGFEAAAFSNAAGNAGFLVAVVRESETGALVGNQYPYGRHHPVIAPLNASDITQIRSSGLSVTLMGSAIAQGKTYSDVPVSRLIFTDSPNVAGGIRMDVSFISKYADTLSGKTYSEAKNDRAYESYPLTLQTAPPLSWDEDGCFSTTKTVNGHSYSVPSLPNQGSAAVETSVAGAADFETFRQTFRCSNGTVSAEGSETSLGKTCVENCAVAGGATSYGTGDTRTASCVGIPANASWNWVSSITQTFSGGIWLPSTTGTYDESLSMTECRFKCESDHSWSGGICGADCTIPASDTHAALSYVLSASGTVTHGQSGQSRSGNRTFGTAPANGSQSATFTYACSDGVLSKTSSNGASSCGTNFSFNGNWSAPACTANVRTWTCAAKPATGTVWNSVASYPQTWSGTLSTWLPADSTTAYDATASATACRYKCDAGGGYGWGGSSCGITVNGACGSSHANTYASAPSTGLCSSGTPSAVATNGTGTGWTWTCAGAYAGTTASCYANASAFVFNYAVSANTNNFNLRAAAVAAGWNQVLPLDATVTVNAGVTVGSVSTGVPAFTTGTGYPGGSSLEVVNYGVIVGK